jgi:hypothetical protein
VVFSSISLAQVVSCVKNSVFCYFCVSEVIHRKYSRNWTKQVPEVLFFSGASKHPRRRRRGATGRPHAGMARPSPWPRRPGVRGPGATSDIAPSPIKTPRREKPKYPINFPGHIVIRRRRRPKDREGQKLFPAPCRRGESPPEVFFIAMLASGAMSE